ncbi:MAG: hypothetical protein H6559_16760 [Lewinellaceae bacterium]|nr:hypothetical protein [Lewinellaceae bacterium]
MTTRFQPLPEKELQLSFVAHRECWETQFDKDKWDKIVYNLLSNAIKFTPPETPSRSAWRVRGKTEWNSSGWT